MTPRTMLAALTIALAGGPAHATDLLAHRAVYDLKLDDRKRGDIEAGDGSMTFKMQDTCEGWASEQRLKMNITNADGQEIVMISDYSTLESKDGRSMTFHMRQTTDDAVTSVVEGDARLDADGRGGTVHYTLPHEATAKLPPGTLFPTAHTEAVLAAGEQGKKFITIPLFDGTSEKGAQDSSIAITAWLPAKDGKWPELARLPSGKFHLAFFDHDAAGQEPDYEVSMRYWENGVADDLAMNFGNFTMDGTLATFTPLEPAKKGC